MMRAGYGEVVRQVGRLLGGGSVAALGEDRLLERFAAEGDGAAFEALVARHGPMVLGTCRRMLGDGHDVEDAFQATFLVLARRAGTIRDADRLGPWLHGVARRVARRARAQSARRRSVEGPGGEDRAIAATDGSVEAAELRAALDEELGRLPEKYRAPLVLCYLEGLTHDEAAGRLRWPVGTVRSRLAGGRDRLRGRLARRGLSPTAAPAALPILHIPTPLMTTTVRLATMAGTPSAHVAALAKGAMIAMMISKLKLIAAFGVLGGLAAGGAGAMTYRSGDGPAKAEAAPAVMPDPARRLAAVREERSKLEEDDETLTSKVKKLEAETQLQIQKIQADGASRREQFLKEIGESRAKQRQLNEEAKALLLQLPPAPPALDPKKEFDAANERIAKLEAELAKLRAATPNGATKGDPPRDAMTATGTVVERRGADLRGAMNARGPGGGAMGGVMASGGMGGGSGGGGGGMMASAAPQTTQVMNLSGGTPNVLVIPPTMDRVTILNTETNARETYRAPEGVTQVQPIFGARGGALLIKGPEIKQVVAFEAQEGRWYPQDLREPAKDQAIPLVGGDAVSYPRGKFIYTFSFEAKKWSVLELKGEAPRAGMFSGGGKAIVPDGDQIHIYNAKTGEWTHLDAKGEK